MSHPYSRRLLKEFRSIQSSNLAGVRVLPASEMTKYLISLSVENPIYAGAQFLLSISIGSDYPVDSPSVQFLHQEGFSIPLHPHIYSNGHICLNVLGKDWTPACGVETIILSIQSMLASNGTLSGPPDDQQYVSRAPKDPKRGNFVYHDDNV